MKKDLSEWEQHRTATLNDYVYTFTGYSPEYKGGTSTLIPVRGGVVLGVAYLISDEQLRHLVETGGGYVLKQNQAVMNGDTVPVFTLQPPEVGPPTPPSTEYVTRVRRGLNQHYPSEVVDLYLARALKRASNATPLLPKTPTPDAFKREYGVDLRRLFPWNVTKSTAFGSAWALIHPGEETEPQAHDEEEAFIVISGEGLMNLDGHEFSVRKGDTIYIEPFSAHTVRNSTEQPLEVLCVWWGGVTPAPASGTT